MRPYLLIFSTYQESEKEGGYKLKVCVLFIFLLLNLFLFRSVWGLYGTYRSTLSLWTVLNVTANIHKQVIVFFFVIILIECNVKLKLSATKISHRSVGRGAV